MDIWEVRRALNQAETTIKAGDTAAKEIAPILVGRLRHCDNYILAALKRELRDFNIHTKEWKDR